MKKFNWNGALFILGLLVAITAFSFLIACVIKLCVDVFGGNIGGIVFFGSIFITMTIIGGFVIPADKQEDKK